MSKFAIALIAAAAVLAGCKDSPQPAAAPAAPAAQPAAAAPAAVTIEAIAEKAQGFTVGAPMSARVAYVFFDAQCPHCAALWASARPLKSQARFVWIPVSLMNPSSTTQGAALLAAADPVMAMDGHEASMKAQRGGILAEGNLENQKKAIEANTVLFNQFKFESVPTIVTKNAQTGQVVTRSGALPTDGLKALLGI
jgi:thiol:disulfide interchange protein DsbG